MVMGVVPLIIESSSLYVVRNALAIRMFISLHTQKYLHLLNSYFNASIHTVARYNKRGKITPLYIVFRVLCLRPQDILRDLETLKFSLVHLSAACLICLLNLSLSSITIPKY